MFNINNQETRSSIHSKMLLMLLTASDMCTSLSADETKIVKPLTRDHITLICGRS